MFTAQHKQIFEDLHKLGMEDKNAGNREASLEAFTIADQLAEENGEARKRLDVLQPAAHQLWSLGRYEEAEGRLITARRIAHELGLTDERGMVASNMGRLAAVEVLNSVPPHRQAEELATVAAPQFKTALETLWGHPHLYFRYANAQHGSVVAALAGQRFLTARLVAEGLTVAFRKSKEPYDQKKTHKLGRGGMTQMAAATALIPFGGRTPFLAAFARRKLVR